MKLRRFVKVYLVDLLIGVDKNWAILQKLHLEACYTPNFHPKLEYDTILDKYSYFGFFSITLKFWFY